MDTVVKKCEMWISL